MKFCNQCASPVTLKIPPDDDRERFVCDRCEIIHYQNPRIVVCTLPRYQDKVLLCKRAIEPRHGLWTLPGGFLENGETTLEGALRETREEACADVNISGLYTLYNIPHIDQVHMFFLSALRSLDFAPGPESLEVRLFTRDQVPWDDIAFPGVANTLEHYFNDLESQHFPLRLSDVVLDEHKRRAIRPHF